MKEAEMPPTMIAQAMGHLSAESQGKYARARRTKGKLPPRPFFAVGAAKPVSVARAPMARFKAASALKRARKGL